MAKFGSQASYKVGDAVLVKRMPLYGVAHVVQQNDGIKRDRGNSPAKAGSYEVKFNCGTSIVECEIDWLKPATVKEDVQDQARVEKDRLRDEQNRAETTRLLGELQKSKPIRSDEEFMRLGFTPDALSQFRAEDYLAIKGGGQLGYAGCPRIDFLPGERVRMRKGVNLKRWELTTEGECGTVVESDPSQALFPVCSSQPKGIKVQWDVSGTLLTYVTNLEPVVSDIKPVKVEASTRRKFEFDD
jgi:hypothetical protein